MPRPREAKPTTHPGVSPKKSDYDRLTTYANTHGVLTTLSIRRNVSDYLDPLSNATDPIRLSQEKEGKRVSGYLTEGIKA